MTSAATWGGGKGQGLVAVVVIVILALLGPAIGKIFSNVVKAI